MILEEKKKHLNRDRVIEMKRNAAFRHYLKEKREREIWTPSVTPYGSLQSSTKKTKASIKLKNNRVDLAN